MNKNSLLNQNYICPMGADGVQLIRLHDGHETQFVAADDAERRLHRLWLEYRKPMPAGALGKRFDLVGLRRAAAYDPHLRDALALLGLLPSP